MNTLSWLNTPGASPEAIERLRLAVGPLPPSYLDCLRAGNGGETGLRVDPFTLCLDSVEAALDFWRSDVYPMPGVFVFGGDGGLSLLAFDLGVADTWPVICFDPIDPEGSIEAVANSFEELLTFCEAA